MSEKPHKRLKVWQEAIALAQIIYSVTEAFPQNEQFGLSAQMRRAAVSVCSNIAEGAARMASKEKMHFFIIARGSLSELDTQCELSLRLGYLKGNDTFNKLNFVSCLLQGLIESRRRLQ